MLESMKSRPRRLPDAVTPSRYLALSLSLSMGGVWDKWDAWDRCNGHRPLILSDRRPIRLSRSDVQRLASLFDRLDAESRKVGDISKSENVSKLKHLFDEIDDAVSDVLELPSEELEDTRSVAELLMERRKERSGEATPSRLTGMDRTRITRPKPSKKRKVAVPLKKLDEFEEE